MALLAGSHFTGICETCGQLIKKHMIIQYMIIIFVVQRPQLSQTRGASDHHLPILLYLGLL